MDLIESLTLAIRESVVSLQNKIVIKSEDGRKSVLAASIENLIFKLTTREVPGNIINPINSEYRRGLTIILIFRLRPSPRISFDLPVLPGFVQVVGISQRKIRI